MHKFDLTNYTLEVDEEYCPHGDCEVVNYHEQVIPGTMWGEWPDFV